MIKASFSMIKLILITWSNSKNIWQAPDQNSTQTIFIITPNELKHPCLNNSKIFLLLHLLFLGIKYSCLINLDVL